MAKKSTDPKREITVKDHQTGNVSVMTARAFESLQNETCTKNGVLVRRYTDGPKAVAAVKPQQEGE